MKTTFLVLLLTVLCPSLRANDLAYSTDVDGFLWLVDFTSLSATKIGNTGNEFEGIALRSDGVLFGVNIQGLLHTIDRSTGASTLVGDTGLGNVGGLDFNGDQLLAMKYDQDVSRIHSINETTAASSLLVSLDTRIGTALSMAVKNPETLMVVGLSTSPTLYQVDLSDGTTFPFRIHDAFIEVNGIDYINGFLYGVGDDGKLYFMRTATGTPNIIGDVGEQLFLSMASLTDIKVPEPSGLVLLGLCVLGVISHRR